MSAERGGDMEPDMGAAPRAPGALKRAGAFARLLAASLFWRLAEAALSSALGLCHRVSRWKPLWMPARRYFHVAAWLNVAWKAGRQARLGLWRARSGFPAPGFSERARPKGGQERAQAASEALTQPDTPWGDPACEKDLLWAIDERAAMLADHPARLFGAASTLDAIPPDARAYDEAFRLALERLRPGWADLGIPADDYVGQRMLREEDLRRSIERARKSQRAFLEARAVGASLPPTPDSPRPARRL